MLGNGPLNRSTLTTRYVRSLEKILSVCDANPSLTGDNLRQKILVEDFVGFSHSWLPVALSSEVLRLNSYTIRRVILQGYQKPKDDDHGREPAATSVAY